MGVCTPGSPCCACPRHNTDCPFNNLLNPFPECPKWTEWTVKVEQEIKEQFRRKREKKSVNEA